MQQQLQMMQRNGGGVSPASLALYQRQLAAAVAKSGNPQLAAAAAAAINNANNAKRATPVSPQLKFSWTKCRPLLNDQPLLWLLPLLLSWRRRILQTRARFVIKTSPTENATSTIFKCSTSKCAERPWPTCLRERRWPAVVVETGLFDLLETYLGLDSGPTRAWRGIW